jgi:hypothetical protein
MGESPGWDIKRMDIGGGSLTQFVIQSDVKKVNFQFLKKLNFIIDWAALSALKTVTAQSLPLKMRLF